MADYLKKHSSRRIPTSTIRGQRTRNQSLVKIDPRRFRIRMYFESTCPHCKKMMGTLRKLQAEGYFVEIFQIDKGVHKSAQYPLPLKRAKSQDIKKYGIKSVPFTLIADLKNQTVSKPIIGYQSTQEMKNIISLMRKNKKWR